MILNHLRNCNPRDYNILLSYVNTNSLYLLYIVFLYKRRLLPPPKLWSFVFHNAYHFPYFHLHNLLNCCLIVCNVYINPTSIPHSLFHFNTLIVQLQHMYLRLLVTLIWWTQHKMCQLALEVNVQKAWSSYGWHATWMRWVMAK